MDEYESLGSLRSAFRVIGDRVRERRLGVPADLIRPRALRCAKLTFPIKEPAACESPNERRINLGRRTSIFSVASCLARADSLAGSRRLATWAW